MALAILVEEERKQNRVVAAVVAQIRRLVRLLMMMTADCDSEAIKCDRSKISFFLGLDFITYDRISRLSHSIDPCLSREHKSKRS